MRILRKNKGDISKKLYWLIPIFLVLVQLIYINQSLIHIRQEELTESVSNVYWLQKGNVCSGITTNIGWYYQLMFVYNIFGFNLAVIKIYKLFLIAISLFCLAAILKKYLGERAAWFPLLIIGLSPTLLYFNSLSIHFGMDLVYFPICLYLVLRLKFNNQPFDYFKQVLLWLIAMIAWMSYPTFLSYLPILLFLFVEKLCLFIYRQQKAKAGKKGIILRLVLVNLIAFLTPLILGILFVKNKSMLLYDPRNNSGLFRGNGGVNLDLSIIWDNLLTTLKDLFYLPSSYYFELAEVEFSSIYPIIPVIAVLLICGYFFLKKKNTSLILGLLLIYFFTNIIFTSLTGTIGGIRRATSVLAIFYILFVFSFCYLVAEKKINKHLKFTLIGILSLLLVHHLLALPANFQYLKQPSNYREGAWFYTDKTPQKSLNNFIAQVHKEDLSLICADEKGKPAKCQRFGYNLIYPAVAGSCLWNNLYCHQVKIYDFNKNQIVPLSLDCWRDDL
ncbi:hypothetical protein HYS91_03110 [Candidatus Daviesbacteria bacterium]|nr:hypothetical protein [Candidatus Daviesbacteria bacterium]